MDPVGLSSVGRGGAGWQGFLLVIAGWAGVGLTYGATWVSRDPTSGETSLLVAGLAIVSLAVMGSGAAISVAAALSPMRHVFKSGPAFRIAWVLLGIAVTSIAFLLVQRAPFDGIVAHGMPLAEVIADLTYIVASTICIVAGGVALREAWHARRHERSWGWPARRATPPGVPANIVERGDLAG